jgi:hypothetical protein
MPFQRPQASGPLNKEERARLLLNYLNHYREVAQQDLNALNRTIPRGAFDDLLDRIGCLLLEEAMVLANAPGPVRDFLIANPLPKPLKGLLPDDFRVFCLALNALKQWLAAEQAATDRYLLGGKARQECRAAATTCVVTGESFESAQVELHHPVRDGRPPIPLSQRGHERLEGQTGSSGNDRLREKIGAIRSRMNRSWVHLRQGCLALLGREAVHSTTNVAAASRAFGRKIAKETGLTPEQILAWLDENGL